MSTKQARTQCDTDCPDMLPKQSPTSWEAELQNKRGNQTSDKEADRRTLEIEAYHSVAFAFFATGNGMTDRKESLLKELREKWQIPDSSWNAKRKRSLKTNLQSRSESKTKQHRPAV